MIIAVNHPTCSGKQSVAVFNQRSKQEGALSMNETEGTTQDTNHNVEGAIESVSQERHSWIALNIRRLRPHSYLGGRPNAKRPSSSAPGSPPSSAALSPLPTLQHLLEDCPRQSLSLKLIVSNQGILPSSGRQHTFGRRPLLLLLHRAAVRIRRLLRLAREQTGYGGSQVQIQAGLLSISAKGSEQNRPPVARTTEVHIRYPRPSHYTPCSPPPPGFD